MLLYKFQRDYLRDLPKNCIMAADTGTGKSAMSLIHASKHMQSGDKLLIIAPASKVKTNDWEREIADFTPELMGRYEVMSYNKMAQPATFMRLHKSPDTFYIIFDEGHNIKNASAKRSKAARALCNQSRGFCLLTATPLANGWQDAINYWLIFKLCRTMTEFRNRYMIIQTFKGWPEIVGYSNTEELARIWNTIARPLRKQDCLDLPDITSITVSFDAPTEYKQTLKTRISPAGEVLDNPSLLLHTLRQIPGPVKIDWLSDFLEGTSDNVVIFYAYKSDKQAALEMIQKHHKDRTVFMIDGDNHQTPTKEDWPNLQRTITLAQYQAGATGIELTYSSTIIYLSPTYSYQDYEQSVGRIYRNGQTSKCTLYRLVATPTVEQAIYRALDNKQDFNERMWLETQI